MYDGKTVTVAGSIGDELGIDESTFFNDYDNRPVLVADHIDVRG